MFAFEKIELEGNLWCWPWVHSSGRGYQQRTKPKVIGTEIWTCLKCTADSLGDWSVIGKTNAKYRSIKFLTVYIYIYVCVWMIV